MPAYNFQARFATMVRQRIKRQTIRAERKDGRVPKLGERFVGYTGMRTKNCRKLVEGRICQVLPVTIGADGIRLDGHKLGEADANALALLDGFKHANEMMGWFIENHGRNFTGHLIRWL